MNFTKRALHIFDVKLTDRDLLVQALIELCQQFPDGFPVAFVGSETDEKAGGISKGLELSKLPGLVVRVKAASLVEAEPTFDTGDDGSYNRGYQAYYIGKQVVLALASQYQLTLKGVVFWGIGVENIADSRIHETRGAVLENRMEYELGGEPVFRRSESSFQTLTVQDVVFMTLFWVEGDVERHIPLYGGSTLLPPWFAPWLAAGVEAGKLAKMYKPEAEHDTGKLVAGPHTAEWLSRIFNIACALILVIAYYEKQHTESFFHEPTPEQLSLLKSWIGEPES